MDHGRPVLYRVAQVGDDQFVVLPIDDPLPAGATEVGHSGTHGECLQFLRSEHASRRDRPGNG